MLALFRRKPVVVFRTDLEPGDVVRLKSGGPPMTVDYIINISEGDYFSLTPGVYCQWISVDGKPQRGRFFPEMLLTSEEPA